MKRVLFKIIVPVLILGLWMLMCYLVCQQENGFDYFIFWIMVGFPYGIRKMCMFLMFENLWQEWFDTKLFLLAKDTPMEGMGYSEIFQCLPEQEKRALTERKAYFAKTAEME